MGDTEREIASRISDLLGKNGQVNYLILEHQVSPILKRDYVEAESIQSASGVNSHFFIEVGKAKAPIHMSEVEEPRFLATLMVKENLSHFLALERLEEEKEKLGDEAFYLYGLVQVWVEGEDKERDLYYKAGVALRKVN